MRCISVLIADLQPVVLEGLTSLLGTQSDFRIVASCRDERSCIEAIQKFAPDIAILDVGMPGLAGPEMLSLASSKSFSTRLVYFCVSAEDCQPAVSAGVCSVILKGATLQCLLRSLREIADGHTLLPQPASDQAAPPQQNGSTALAVLTFRERQITRLVSEGLSNKQIGRMLKISDGTIKVHLHHIFRKLEVGNRTVLAALAKTHHDAAVVSLAETGPKISAIE